MPASTLAAKAPFQQIVAGQDHKTALKIEIDIFDKFSFSGLSLIQGEELLIAFGP
jgi:hypothetical protein